MTNEAPDVEAIPLRRAPRNWVVALCLFALATVVYLAVAGDRNLKAGPDNHFSYLADSYLHGTLAVRCLPDDPRGVCPPGYGGNDWAKFNDKWYVTFPPFPAVVYMPFVRAYGRDFANVRVDCLIGALAPALFYLLLERLARRAHRESKGTYGRSWKENLLFSVLLAFGTVYFFTVVQGSVWFTAHVISVPLAIGYLWFALGIDDPLGAETLEFLWFLRPLGLLKPVREFLSRPRPVLSSAMAGLFLGMLMHTRATFVYASPFFVIEAIRANTAPGARSGALDLPEEGSLREQLLARFTAVRAWVLRVNWLRAFVCAFAFGLPMLLALLINFKLNSERFGDPMEVGYRFLQIGWKDRIEHWGLFNYHYLSRNLAVALASLPWITRTFPFVLISRHGLALWFTTPQLLGLARVQREKHAVFTPMLACTAGLIALIDLLYQNSGWVQFGFRFSNDFIVFLLVLLAINARRRIGAVWIAGLVFAIAVNLFGALTFDRVVKWRGRETNFYDNDNSQQRYFQPD